MVMVVMVILVGVATPAMQTMIERNRTESQLNALYGSLMMARSESITRNQNAILCMSSNGTSCTVSGNWEQGWLLFMDEDSDGVYGSGDERIRSQASLQSLYTLRADSALASTVVFRANGTALNTGNFKLCPPSADVQKGFTVVLSITGRARISEGVDECP